MQQMRVYFIIIQQQNLSTIIWIPKLAIIQQNLGKIIWRKFLPSAKSLSLTLACSHYQSGCSHSYPTQFVWPLELLQNWLSSLLLPLKNLILPSGMTFRTPPANPTSSRQFALLIWLTRTTWTTSLRNCFGLLSASFPALEITGKFLFVVPSCFCFPYGSNSTTR